MAYYKDLREHMETLEAKGKLIRVERQMNKDTELMPLVRWQFRGLPERDRKAFLFTNVVDVKGKRYKIVPRFLQTCCQGWPWSSPRILQPM